MITVTILYPNSVGARFDVDYYINRHMPMTIKCLGNSLRGVIVEHGLAGVSPGSPPAHLAICHLFFDSVDSFLEAFAPHAEKLQGDIPNYTTIKPIIQYGEARILR